MSMISLFLAWMEYNKNSEEAMNLTYYQFPRFYVWKQDTYYSLGLLDDEEDYINGIMEASFGGFAHYLWDFFVMLLKLGKYYPMTYWLINEESLELEFEKLSIDAQPDQEFVSHGFNKMIQDELRYNREELIREHQTLISNE
ncbi:hypothetical protein V2J09_011195 [Rumex salicifolius]